MSSEALRQLRIRTLKKASKKIHIILPVSLALCIGPELRSPRWVESSTVVKVTS